MSQLRNAIIANQKEVIPSRYIVASYIEMDGANYINTGIPAVDNTSVEVSFSKNWTTLGSGRCYIFWQGEGDYGGVRYYNDNATILRGGYGAQTWGNAPSQSIPEPSTLYFAKSDYKLNGTSFSGFNLGGNFHGNYIIGNDHTDITQLPVCIWGFKIWDTSANLVFDAVPVYDTQTKEAGMYDKVTDTFFPNDGTGIIKAYDENNNLISDYTILDHCYFSASPVITDIKPKSTWTDLKLSIMPKSSTSNPYVLCARTSSSSTDKLELRTYFTTLKFYAVIGGNSTVYPTVQDLSARSDIDIDGTDIKITNSGATTTTSVGSTPGFVNCDYPVCIGGLKDGNTMSSSYKMTGYFYGMQVYDNNVLAHNVVPAKNYLNEVCLYNTVTKIAYYPVSGTLLEDAPLVNDGVFKFTVDTTKTGNNNYFSVTGATYTTDWGDGTTSSGYNHTYSTPGTYQVTITFQNPTAAFSEFKINNGRLISVDTPFPTGTTAYWPYQVLAYTGNLQSVHKDLFAFNSQLTETQEMFAYSGIQTLPAGIFDPLTNITWFDNVFLGSSITTLPAGIFDKMTSMNRASNLFQDCANLETVPDGLFAKNLLLKQFSNTFKNCTKLKLNKNIFCMEDTEKTTRFMTGSQSCSFSNVFNRTEYTGIEQGEAPALWDYTFSTLGSHNTCYSGAGNSATSISNYSSIPSGWGGAS